MGIDGQLARQLLAGARLDDRLVARKLEQALSIDYWRTLQPQLSVAGTSPLPDSETAALLPEHQGALLAQFGSAGYLQVESALPPPLLEAMHRCALLLQREDWPPVFAFVYDAFWQVPQLPKLAALLGSILGSGYRQSANFWFHAVPALPGAGGWPPHQDYPDRTGRVTVWMALSPATPANGCLYAVPKNAPVGSWRDDLQMLTKETLLALLHHSRALPVAAGAALIWDGELLHWGGKSDGTGEPRLSFSTEFLAAQEEPTARERPLFDPTAGLPPFAERLGLIGRAILDYYRNEVQLIRYLDLAQHLCERAGS